MENQQPYTQGFNNGYILAKYEPQLINTITKNIHPSTDYLEGLLSGKEKFELEHRKDKINELQILRVKSKDRDISLEKDV